ncbi:hypothetical protein KI387_042098, partial [Taxus chinensis]
MAAPRLPRIALSCDLREMAFWSRITDNQLKRIFLISCVEEMEAIKAILGGVFLSTEGWPHVNSGVTSVFVENLLIIRPSKLDVVNLALHWLRPAFCGNLASEVANCCLAFWAMEDSLQGASGVDVGVFKELEKRLGILLAFTKRLVVYAWDRVANHVCLVLLNVQALSAPLEPVSSGWAELKMSVGGAYDFLWLGWVNVEVGSVKVELEEEDCLGRVSLASSVVVSLETG